MIEVHRIKESKIDVNRLVNYGLFHLQSSYPSVRQQAYFLLLNIYEQIGAAMLPYLGSQRNSQSEVFQKARAFIDQGDVKRAYDYVSQ